MWTDRTGAGRLCLDAQSTGRLLVSAPVTAPTMKTIPTVHHHARRLVISKDSFAKACLIFKLVDGIPYREPGWDPGEHPLAGGVPFSVDTKGDTHVEASRDS